METELVETSQGLNLHFVLCVHCQGNSYTPKWLVVIRNGERLLIFFLLLSLLVLVLGALLLLVLSLRSLGLCLIRLLAVTLLVIVFLCIPAGWRWKREQWYDLQLEGEGPWQTNSIIPILSWSCSPRLRLWHTYSIHVNLILYQGVQILFNKWQFHMYQVTI